MPVGFSPRNRKAIELLTGNRKPSRSRYGRNASAQSRSLQSATQERPWVQGRAQITTQTFTGEKRGGGGGGYSLFKSATSEFRKYNVNVNEDVLINNSNTLRQRRL